MNINSIKKIYERLPRPVKFFFAPFFVRGMVDNSVFRSALQEINDFDALDQDARRSVQFEKLKETLIYAYENVPFYAKRFDDFAFDPYSFSSFEELNTLPLLEKKDAVAAGEELYSTDSSLEYYETFTGGSSGQALRVLLDKDSIYKERAYVCNFLSKQGYDMKETRTVAFWGHNKSSDYYYSPLKNEIVISPFRLFKEEELDGICSDIESFGAEYIAGYPSAIAMFASKLNHVGRSMRFKTAVFYAENYSEEEKALVERTFHCQTCSYYGHTERAVFAEIINENCIFQDSYGYTELLPTEYPNEYRIVCTGFLSRKMPLIRYATDDIVQIDKDGNYKLVGHKRSDVHLIAKNGAPIFKGAMTLHLSQLSGITRYQYYQNEPGLATLRLMANNISDADIDAILDYLQTRTEGLLEITIEQVEQIDLTSRGKEKWAIVDIPDDFYQA